MKKIIYIILILTLTSGLHSLIRTVSPDSTMQYTRIQTAIDASVNGDTVLVYPGRYRTNLYFNGKNILVTSLYLYNPSDSIVAQTIIDGHQNEACVNFVNGETYQATLNGFTVENGIGYYFNYLRYGGGIRIKDSFATIKNCVIQNNFATLDGGGVCITESSNSAGVILSNNTIKDNRAYETGGLSVRGNADIYFDPVNLNHIYANHGGTVHDLAILNPVTINIPLGTASCSELNSDYIFTASPSNYTAQNGLLQFVNHDLYIAPDGDDDNSGLSLADPLQTISKAFEKIASDSLNPKKIFLASGTYSRSGNNQIFPVNLKKYVSLIGESPDNTIIDCEGDGGIFIAYEGDNYFSMKNLQIYDINTENLGTVYNQEATRFYNPKNVSVENCKFINCHPSSIGRNSYYWDYNPENTSLKLSNLTFDGFNSNPINVSMVKSVEINNIIIKNSIPYIDEDFWMAPSYIGIDFYTVPWRGDIKMSNILIENNHNSISNWPSNHSFSAFFLAGKADFKITNMTITNNSSLPAGGTILVVNPGNNIYLYNSLIYGNSPNQIWFDENPSPSMPNNIYINNCLIQGGQSAIRFDSTNGNFSHWENGNLNTDPLFLMQGEHPYSLSPNSPCINAGTTSIPDFTFPETDLAGNPRISGQGIDIGAYEYHLQPVDFIASAVEGDAPLTVHFTDMSDNAISWSWDFNNDGLADSDIQNPSFTYLEEGVYSVRLTINGSQSILKPDYIHVNPSGNQDSPNLVKDELFPAKPNPFSIKTAMKMTVKDRGKIKVEIYNVKGQKVKTLFDANVPTSEFDMVWEGKDQKGNRVASGIYTFVMKRNNKIIQTQKVTVLK